MANLMSGGGTWLEYNVTSDQLDTRVGSKIARGAPKLWDWARLTQHVNKPHSGRPKGHICILINSIRLKVKTCCRQKI
eukprot:gene56052-biopygen46348